MSIIAYVSGHGLGHSTREIEILNRIPADIPLVVKTSAPEWFWRTEMSRPFEYVPVAFDVGCIQKNGLEMDIPATLHAWHTIDRQNKERLASEIESLRTYGARLVVSDVAAFPLTVAAKSGIPSVCVANFTWADIYQAFVEEEPGFLPIISALEAEYATATLHLEAGFSLPMPLFAHSLSIGLVVRQGIAQQDKLLAALPLNAQKKRLALVYVGGWGLPIDYRLVENFPDWHFISLDAPQTLPQNWTVLARDIMPHPDLVASVDVVISKPGYGIGGECVSSGTPLIYPPREGFAEYAPFHTALSQWVGGINIPLKDFLAVNWNHWLEAVPPYQSVPRLPTNGGEKAAAILVQRYRENLGI